MRELSKSIARRCADRRFAFRYFVGHGIDIGAGDDPLWQYHDLFPLIQSTQVWDVGMGHGDAQLMAGVEDNAFDFVHSSHCLEHVHDPREALANWLRIVKPGGHVVVMIPDEDLYEQGVWPSTWNPDHKHTFTMQKLASESWSPVSEDLLLLFRTLGPACQVLKIELLDAAYHYGLPRLDQTLGVVTDRMGRPLPLGDRDASIEFVLRKRPQAEIDQKGRFNPPPPAVP